jgi:hypothetical protein
MATKTEGQHANAAVISEVGYISRDEVTVVSGQNLLACAVVGKITASGKYKEYDNAASDGSEVAAAMLLDACDATGGDTKAAVIARLAELHYDELVWKSGASQGDKDAGVADLAAKDIIVRTKTA